VWQHSSVGLFAFFFPAAAVRQALGTHRITALRDLRERSIAKVAGAIEPMHAAVRSPFSGAEGAMCHLRVDIAAAGDTGWYPAIRHSEGGALWIVDDTGRAVIEPACSEAAFRGETTWTHVATDAEARLLLVRLLTAHHSGFREWRPGEALEYLDRHGLVRTARVHESVVPAGARLEVAGMARLEPVRDPAASSDYRAPPTALVFRAAGRVPLLLADAPDAPA
jgi:hypothetical protein